MAYRHCHAALLVSSLVLIPVRTTQGQRFQEGKWRTTEWSPCSQSCGPSAKRYRQVICYRNEQRVQNSLCFGWRPMTVEDCPAVDCPPERYEFIECNKTCNTGSASVWGCRFSNSQGDLVGDDLSKCNISDKFRGCTDARSKTCPIFRYKPQPWSQCSETCGNGIQTRELACIKLRKKSKEVAVKKCSHLKEPVKQRPCHIQICPPTYEYEYDNWSSCNTTCGLGQQRRQVYCVQRWTNGTRRIVNRDICDKFVTGKVKETQTCTAASSSSCKWTRETREAKPCSQGESFFHLTSRCKNANTGAIVNDEHCENALGEKPAVRRQRCFYLWKATRWSQCSASCGGGRQERRLTCQSHFLRTNYGEAHQVSDTLCKRLYKPSEKRHCNIIACPDVKDVPHSGARLRLCFGEEPYCDLIRDHDLNNRFKRRFCDDTLFQKKCPCSCSIVLFP